MCRLSQKIVLLYFQNKAINKNHHSLFQIMHKILTLAGLLFGGQAYLNAQVSGNINYEESGNYNKDAGNYHRTLGNANLNANYNTTPKVFASAPQSVLLSNAVVLEVNALFNKNADAYVAIFSITQTGETASEAEQLAQNRYEGLLAELLKLGLKKEDIYLDMISFVPIYEYEVEKKIFSKSYNEVPKGFEIQQNIHIKFTNRDMTPKLVSAAAKNEIYDIVKVDYFVENQAAIYQELRQKSLEYISKATDQFKAMNIDLDTVYQVFAEQEYAVFPLESYTSYQAFASTSIESKKSKTTSVNNIRKPRTMFYNHVPYNNFQIVINPTTLEPAVQFMYNIKVQYTLKTPVQTVTKNQKEFIWLTPQGTQQVLKLEDK